MNVLSSYFIQPLVLENPPYSHIASILSLLLDALLRPPKSPHFGHCPALFPFPFQKSASAICLHFPIIEFIQINKKAYAFPYQPNLR